LSIIAILSVIVLGACGNNETGNENKEEANESENTYTIGVTQLLEHPSLDNAYEGFQEAIEEAGLDVEYDYQNAQNDQNNVKPIIKQINLLMKILQMLKKGLFII